MGHIQFLLFNRKPLWFWPRLLWRDHHSQVSTHGSASWAWLKQQSSRLLLHTASHLQFQSFTFLRDITLLIMKTCHAHAAREQIYSSLCSHYGFQSPNSVHSIGGQHTKEKGMTSHSYHLGSAISVTNVVIWTVQILLVSSTTAGSKSYFSSGH